MTTFLYAIGSLGNFAVRKSLESGARGRAVASVVVLMMSWPLSGHAQEQHAHLSNDLVAVVREATERFKDVGAAEREGYHLLFGCVSGSDWGAMGLHYANGPLIVDGELNASQPEIVIYEPTPSGRPRIIGADYLVFAADWDAKHPGEPPQLMGQLLHLFTAPNRFGLPDFYTLHVWAWKENPNGTFVNWHPSVSCAAFSGQPQ